MLTSRRKRAIRARAAAAFGRLIGLMQTLRSTHGCPWDRKQTHATLRPFLIEEAYEFLDAVDANDSEEMCTEIGDVLFQCVFHAQIAAEDKRFEMADAIESICQKLIRRHPHVFTPSGRPLGTGGRAKRKARTAEAVLEQWEQIKATEQKTAGSKARSG